MSPKRSFSTGFAAALVLGGAAGYWIGSKSTSPDSKTSETSLSAAMGAADPAQNKPSRKLTVETLAAKIPRLSSLPVARSLSPLLQGLPAAELKQLATDVQDWQGEKKHKLALLNEILAYWYPLEPASCWEFCVNLGPLIPDVAADLLAEMAASDPAAAWERMQKLAESGDQQIADAMENLEPAIIEEWVRIAPQAALKVISSKKEPFDAVTLLFRIWAQEDRAAAMTAVDQVMDREIRSECIESIHRTAIDGDPDPETAAWYFSLPEDKQIGDYEGEMFESLTKQDVRKAEAVFEAQKDADNRQYFAGKLAEAKAEQNIAAAQIWAKSLKGPAERNAALTALGPAMSSQSVEDILKTADEIGDDDLRSQFVSGALTSDSPTLSLSKWKKLFTALPEDDRQRYIGYQSENLLASQARVNPMATAELALELNLPPSSAPWEGIFKVWIEKDPAAAADWLFPLRERGQLTIYPVERAMGEWIKRDPLVALAAVDRFLPEEQEEQRLRMLTTLSLESVEALEKILPQLNGNAKEAANYLLKRNEMDKAIREPDHGLAFLMEMIQSEYKPSQDTAKVHILAAGGSFGKTDPLAGVKAFENLPQGDPRAFYVSGFVSEWVKQDPLAASQWASQLPTGKDRSYASASIADYTASKDPAAAWQWAIQMIEGEDKQHVCSRVLSTWQATDPEAAAAAAKSANIPLPPARQGKGKGGFIGDGFGSGDPFAAPK